MKICALLFNLFSVMCWEASTKYCNLMESLIFFAHNSSSLWKWPSDGVAQHLLRGVLVLLGRLRSKLNMMVGIRGRRTLLGYFFLDVP